METKFFNPFENTVNDNDVNFSTSSPNVDKSTSPDVVEANHLFISNRMLRGEHVTQENSGLNSEEWTSVLKRMNRA